ncbi:MAG: hypothetical protein ACYS47_12475 [Planctomycetota bacterium]|jgi:hypothetical protein
MRKKRWLLFAALLLVCLGAAFVVYFIVFGLSAAAYLVRKPSPKTAPELYRVPVERKLGIGTDRPGTKISRFGFTLQVPWQGVVERRETGDLSVTTFENGKGVMIYNPEVEPNFYEALDGEAPEGEKGLLFRGPGSGIINSEYALFKTALARTPDEVSLFMGRERAVRTCLQLAWKRLIVTSHANGIYLFRRGKVKGFQIGLPPDCLHVQIHVFPEPSVRVPFDLFMMKGRGGEFTQEEIDAVLLSFQRAE